MHCGDCLQPQAAYGVHQIFAEHAASKGGPGHQSVRE